MRTTPTLLLLSIVACGREAQPSAAPDRSAVPAASTASPVPVTSTAPSATASALPPVANASGPVRTKDDAAARALPAVDAALHRAYAQSKSSALGGAHPGPFIRAEDAQVKGDATNGFTVSWSRHPPAGYELDASATVSGPGVVKVTKAEVTFSPD